jgi:hypothetical protein
MKGRSLDVMSTIKKNIVTVKAAINCLAYGIMAPVNGDPKYKSYSNSRDLKKPVKNHSEDSGVDITNS